jgi:hypothetical protein
MWAAIVAFVQRLFGWVSAPETGHTRTPKEAGEIRDGVLRMLAEPYDAIVVECPWCNAYGSTLHVSRLSQHVRCDACHRTTDIDALRRRLNDAGVYERAIV